MLCILFPSFMLIWDFGSWYAGIVDMEELEHHTNILTSPMGNSLLWITGDAEVITVRWAASVHRWWTALALCDYFQHGGGINNRGFQGDKQKVCYDFLNMDTYALCFGFIYTLIENMFLYWS